jgi:hypothetical protein
MASKFGALLATGSAIAVAVTPVEKVTKLLTDLKTSIETEGTEEATTYEAFACFCKDTTGDKSEGITTGKDNIDTTSADIVESTAKKEDLESELSSRKADDLDLKARLEKATIRCQKESAIFEAKILDMTKALSSLESAIKSLKESKPAEASLLAVKSKAVMHSLAVADALNLVKTKKQQKVVAFLQGGKVDPEDPDYKFASSGIIETLEQLEKDFKEKKDSTQSEWDKHTESCKDLKQSLADEIEANADAIKSLGVDINEKKAEIADFREELVNLEATLKDDQLYLKDLTERCEKRAAVWDQRSKLRGNEIEALSQALTIIEGTVTEKDAVNVRAMLLQNGTKAVNASSNSSLVKNMSEKMGKVAMAMSNASGKVNRTEMLKAQQSALKGLLAHLKGSITGYNKNEESSKEVSENQIKHSEERVAEDKKKLNQTNLSSYERELLVNRTEMDERMVKYWTRQRQSAHSMFHANLKMSHGLMSKVKNIMGAYEEMLSKGKLSSKVAQEMAAAESSLRGAKASFLQTDANAERMAERALHVGAMLQEMAGELKSPALAAISVKVSANPFAKVKELIQKLVERLIAESTAEATKKGFCDTEVGKAKKDRDFRWTDTGKLTASLANLHAKEDELIAAITTLTEAKQSTQTALEEAQTLRDEQKAENLDSIKDARAGKDAVSEAIGILKQFYKQSAKAKVLLQASPVDEEDPGASDTAYQGNQAASGGIICLLEVIHTDFEHTLTTTEADEKKAAADHVEFERDSKSDIASKEKGIELNSQDLEFCQNNIDQKTRDLDNMQGLLDSALKTLEDLKPTCIDTGMSYEDRVAKREAEIEALKKALCMLDPEGKEADCA